MFFIVFLCLGSLFINREVIFFIFFMLSIVLLCIGSLFINRDVFFHSFMSSIVFVCLCSRQWTPLTHPPKGSSKIRRRIDVES